MAGLYAEMRRRIAAAADDPEGRAAIPGVTLHAVRTPSVPARVLFQPTLYLVVQGAKRLMLGDREITYGGGELVLMGLDLPALVQVTRASEDEPYLSMEIALDRQVLAAVAAEMPSGSRDDAEALTVGPLPAAVLEPALRLLQLMDVPTDARVLADAVKREILYRVLSSPGGASLTQLIQADSLLARIGQVTEWMRDHLEEPVRIDELASRAAMSVTSFHRGFKSVTGTSPGRYHKMLRLHEARRLIVARSDNLVRISAAVGYVSPSQFSRDYKREFGSAPVVDARRFG
ncbi:AraC family transcriptional regulator [Modestobacter sp. VKM Ac-2979]|uniref:AraC family transcriptional regulator n=1 Tax=unclassified Modestobacter TaxID=2643866 RepID=UPI0022ABA58A|nr:MULTISPECIES: AraC family transcriptional regulator [unclassified Modestobacter]MCZ2811945.1 AraC family transcriptional regulator [Modestobacter sp. VKM Ac-2979]MCZ2843668.1 AraC family transcriptional regulator [Modestobacter sp. VKM Ac-2980]